MSSREVFYTNIFSSFNEGSRSGTLVALPPSGYLTISDFSLPNGVRPISPGEIVDIAFQGQTNLVASSINLLTTAGQLLTSNGATNYVVPPAPQNNYFLQSDSAVEGGMTWAPLSAAGGSVAPTPNTIAARSTTGSLAAVGFITTGSIVSGGGSYIYNVGDTVNPFNNIYCANIYGNTSVITGTLTAGIYNGSYLPLAINAPVNFSPSGGAPVVTIGTNGLTTTQALQSAQIIIGTANTTGSWQISVNGSALVFSAWNGTAYVPAGQFSIP